MTARSSFARLSALALVWLCACDDDVVPQAIDLSLGGDRACFLGAIAETVDAGTPSDAGVPTEDAGVPMEDAGTPTVPVAPAGLPFCWGSGNADVTPLEGGRAFTALAVGATSCGTDVTGALYCWGANQRGQLGDGTTEMRTEPRIVPGLVTLAFDVSRFAPGSAGFVCAATTAGTQCWGANDRGQLGDGATLDRATPSPVAGPLSFSSLALGGAHACGLAAGEVWCWGANDLGQLGDGTTVDRVVPTRVPDLEGVLDLAAGAAHTCAVRADGQVLCWGDSTEGQAGVLGLLVTSPREVPDATGFARVASGARHVCAVTVEGRASCWGANESLQTGNGVAVPQVRPVQLSPTGVADVAAGNTNTCARLQSGSILCWGAAMTGVLGASSEADTAFPTRVPGTP